MLLFARWSCSAEAAGAAEDVQVASSLWFKAWSKINRISFENLKFQIKLFFDNSMYMRLQDLLTASTDELC